MKTFRKIEFNSSLLNNEEMKSIKAGFYGGYACNMSGSSSNYSCSSASSNCRKGDGSLGYCTITVTSGPFTKSCACE